MNPTAPLASFLRSHRSVHSLPLAALVGGAALLLAPLPGAHAGWLSGDETGKAREEMTPVTDATLTRVAANLDQIEADTALTEKALRQGLGASSSADVDLAAYTSAQTGIQKRLDDAAADLASLDKKQAYLQGSHKLDENTDLLTSAQREKLGLLQGRRQSDVARAGAMEALVKMASTRKDDLARAEAKKVSRAQTLADMQASQAAATASGANTNQSADYSSATVATAVPVQQAPAPAPTTVIVSDPYYYPPAYAYYPPPYYGYYGRPYPYYYGHPYGPGVVLDFSFGGGHHHH